MTTNTSRTAAAAGARRVDGFDFPLSRRTDPVSVRPGVRVIVRCAVADPADPANPNAVTDVIGQLVSVSPLRVRPADGPEREIAARDVVVLKTLSPAPVRNRDIRAVEQAAAAAFPGKHNAWCGGWFARVGDGITERSNSAVPIGPTASTGLVPLEPLREFYSSHGQPVQLLLPDRIGRAAENIPGARGSEIIVMTRPLGEAPEPALPAGVEIAVDEAPSEQWYSMYHFRGQPLPEEALELLAARIDGTLGFARLTVDGQLAAITRATITTGGDKQWLGYSAVEVAPAFRRRGLGTLLGEYVLHWGHAHGAEAAYLEVITTNTAGRALYHGLGFGEHHRRRSLTVG